MRTKDLLALILCLVTLTCTGRKQTLEDKVDDDTKKTVKTAVATETMGTSVATPGIKYRESRKIDPQNPPIVIDIEKAAENKDFDLNQYYSDVEYIKLNHPLAEQKIGFLGNSNYKIQSGTSTTSGRGLSSSVFLAEDKIVVGDAYFGYHCFDLRGNFLYTIVEKQDIPEYNIRNNQVLVSLDTPTDRIVCALHEQSAPAASNSKISKLQIILVKQCSKQVYFSRGCKSLMHGVVPEALASRKLVVGDDSSEGSETAKSGTDEQKRYMRHNCLG